MACQINGKPEITPHAAPVRQRAINSSCVRRELCELAQGRRGPRAGMSLVVDRSEWRPIRLSAQRSPWAVASPNATRWSNELRFAAIGRAYDLSAIAEVSPPAVNSPPPKLAAVASTNVA